MSAISLIIDGLNTSVAVSSPSYTKLAYQLDVSKNKFKTARKGYAIQVSTGNDELSPIFDLYTTTKINIVLLQSYKNTTNDGDQINTSIEVQQSASDIYKAIISDNIYSGIINIFDFSLEEVSYDEVENTASVTVSMLIKYVEVPVVTYDYMLLEDGFDILQENGSRIIL